MEKNFKKHTDHFVNSILAAPFLLAMGNIPGAITALIVGKALDKKADYDFEQRRKTYDDPCLTIQMTSEQRKELHRQERAARDMIDELPFIKEAEYIKEYGYGSEKYIAISSGDILSGTTKTTYKKGSISICSNYGFDEITRPADLYYHANDWLEALKKDMEIYSNVKIYRIIGISYNYMYTVNNGFSYVVGGGC